MLRVNGRKRIITILLTDQIIRVTVFEHDSISLTHDQYFTQVFKCRPKTFWMWCLHHQKCHQQKKTTKFQKADVMPYQNLTNQLHPKKWAVFSTGWLGWTFQDRSLKMSHGSVCLPTVSGRKDDLAVSLPELARTGSLLKQSPGYWIYMRCVVFFFGGGECWIGDEETHGKQRGSVIDYYGSCMDRLFQFFWIWKKHGRREGFVIMDLVWIFSGAFWWKEMVATAMSTSDNLDENTRNDKARRVISEAILIGSLRM